jgi:hypothetical protein
MKILHLAFIALAVAAPFASANATQSFRESGADQAFPDFEPKAPFRR